MNVFLTEMQKHQGRYAEIMRGLGLQTGAADALQKEADKLSASLDEWGKSELKKLAEKYAKEKKLLEDYGRDTATLTAKYVRERGAMEAKAAHENAIATLNVRLALAKQGSDAELQARRDLINQTLKYELSLLPQHSAKREELEVKAMNEIEALEKAHAERKRSIDLENVAIRLEYAEKGSMDELGLLQEQLELQRQAEVAAAEKSGADVAAINEKWKRKMAEDTGKWALAGMDEASRKRVELLNEQANTELTILNNRYAKGELSAAEYEKKKAETTKKYAADTLNAQLAALDKVIGANQLSAEQQVEAEQKAADLRRQISDKLADDKLTAEKAVTDKLIELTQAVVDFTAQLFSQMYEKRIADLEHQKEELQTAHDDEMELIEASSASKEEEEARKRTQIAITRGKEKEINEQIKQEKQKAAVAEKAAAIIQATTMGILTTMATLAPPPVGLGPVLGIPLAVATGAATAVQIAAIAAQPLPQYEKGRSGGPAEWAVVGEKRHEVILGKDGVTRLTPDHPTLAYLQKGDSVIPSMEEYIRMTAKPEFTTPTSVVNVDLAPMIAEQKRSAEQIKQAIKNQNTLHIHNTRRGMYSVIKSPQGSTTKPNYKFPNK
jgi:hypothetical protein